MFRLDKNKAAIIVLLAVPVILFFANMSYINKEIAVPPLYIGVPWQEIPFAQAKDASFLLEYNNFKFVSSKEKRREKSIQLKGRLSIATKTDLSSEEINIEIDKFKKYYNDSLTSLGWESSLDFPNNYLTATAVSSNGPAGDIVSYIKAEGNKLKLIGVQYSVPARVALLADDGPTSEACPCDLELKVFESDDIDINNLYFR